MPELPEVETVVRGIRPQIVGRTVRKVRMSSSRMPVSFVGPFAKHLTSKTLQAMHRQGKWMFVPLSDASTLVLHLGMTGRLSVEPVKAKLAPHTHLRLELDQGERELRFVDPRRFGEVLLCDSVSFDKRFGPQALGPDALTVAKSDLAQALSKTDRRIKAVLMDQKVVAGIGNIYADEILHACGISPLRSASTLDSASVQLLHREIGKVLNRSIRHHGTTIRDYVNGQGVPGEFQSRLSVYGRASSPCNVCSAPVQLDRTVLTGRATYWCPSCQH